jgi:CubicO group peptidase (beta-lactamase class C family)
VHSFKRCFVIVLLVASTTSVGAASAGTHSGSERIEARAEQLFHSAQTGNYDPSQLADNLKKALPAFARASAKHFQALGTPRSFSLMGSETLPKYREYTVLVTLPHDRLNLLFALDRRDKLAGIFFYDADNRMAQPQLLKSLTNKAQSAAARDEFSGTVLVAKGRKAILERAYGYADRARKIPNTVNTKFRIGSMNKMFTAVAVLQLVEAGKISLQKTVGTYLPDYPNKDIANEVTIHELLTHTGGTGDFFGPLYDKNRLALRTLHDYETLYGARGPKFKPGSHYEYSNYGFILLGLIIERVSGQSYYDYVREHVYAPAGMASTESEPENEPLPNRSMGYTKSGGHWIANTNTLAYRATSAGGGFSTVGDLLKFADALQSYKLLNRTYTQMLLTPKVPAGMLLNYAYGFGVMWQNGVPCFGHTGGAPGMNGDLEVCPSLGYTVITLSNFDPPAASKLASYVTQRLPLSGKLAEEQALR